jgi:hypothetical protein
LRQHAICMRHPFLWNPGIIEIGFQNHPPNRRRFEFEIFDLDHLNLAFLSLLTFVFLAHSHLFGTSRAGSRINWESYSPTLHSASHHGIFVAPVRQILQK